MYINKIDDIIDKIIDDFYINTFVEKKNDKLLSETNFVKFQKEINEIFIDYNKTINISQLRDIIKNEDNIVTILGIVKRYIAYYFFLCLGTFYQGTLDNYTNNLIEFSKNQIGFNYKIQNFFNSENNSTLIGYHAQIKNIYTILETETGQISQIIKKPEMKSAVEFLNLLRQEFINSNFRLENLNNNKKDQAHNIVKTLIILELYRKNEKKDVFNILESIDKEDGEYIFIEIVVPKKRYIDYNSVENILTKREIVRGLTNEFWNFIIDNEEKITITQDSIDDRLLMLINSGIVIPIVDDFL